jgi:hypothetical protein
MTKFAGFEDWVPIFRGGPQTDSSGKLHAGDALIDRAIARFNAEIHEPPACIGHPAHDKPAYGWVAGLKKSADKLGNVLLAKFRHVEPTFASMVQAGRFKKRSAAFYPDGTLRHVAFLGAAPPAVKGLPDVAFADGDFTSFEFTDAPYTWTSLADVFRRLREWFIEKEGQETADRLIPDWKIDDLRAAGNPPAAEPLTAAYTDKEEKNMTFKEKLAKFFNEFLAKMPDDGPVSPVTPASPAFTEADIEKAKTEAAAKEREKVTAEFAAKERAARRAAVKSEIAAFCDGLVKEGKITPAGIKFGLPEILFALAENENQIEFGEAGEKATPFDRMKALLASAKPLVTFGETATRDKDAGRGTGTAGEKLETLVRAKMKDNKDLQYAAAFAEVQRDNPDLAREYRAEFRGEG